MPFHQLEVPLSHLSIRAVPVILPLSMKPRTSADALICVTALDVSALRDESSGRIRARPFAMQYTKALLCTGISNRGSPARYAHDSTLKFYEH